jgi:ankyrin repeat protein
MAKNKFNTKSASNETARRAGRSLSDYLIGAGTGGVDMKYVDYLIAQGANLNTRDKKGNTIAGVAVSLGQADVLKAIVAENGDITSANRLDMSPLMIAAYNGDTACAKILLDAHARLSSANINWLISAITEEDPADRKISMSNITKILDLQIKAGTPKTTPGNRI